MEKDINMLNLTSKIKVVLLNYLKTQFILMLIVTFLVWGILSLLNIKYSVVLAFITGSLSVIPFFGMTVASIAAFLVAIFDQVAFLPNASPIIEGIVILLIFFVLNKIVDLLLTPLFLGKTNKTSPLLLILAVFLGTTFFGFVGAFLAVPVLLVFNTALEHFRSKESRQ